MASNKRVTYSIDIDLAQTAASKQVYNSLESALEGAEGNVEKLNKTFAQLVAAGEDSLEAAEAYNRVIEKSIKDKDKQLATLASERVKIEANVDLTEDQRREQLRLNAASVEAVKASQEELKSHLKDLTAQQKLRAAEKKKRELIEKYQKKYSKLLHTELSENNLIVKAAVKKAELQEKLNKLIGKESKLRKAASKAGSVAAKGAAVVGGGLMGLAGAAVASAGNIADRERALGALKSPATRADVEDVFIKSGGRADFSTIVDSLNKLSSKFSGDELRGNALLDIENPGWADTLMRANTPTSDPQMLRNAIAQIQKNTGVADLSTAMQQAVKARAVTEGKISQLQFLQAHAALTGSGFDDEKARYIIQQIASKGGNFEDNFNKTDFAKYIWNAQEKTRVRQSGISIASVDPTKDISTPEAKAARQTQETIAKFQLKKDEMLANILTKLSESNILDTIADLLDTLITPDVINGIGYFFKFAKDVVDGIKEIVQWFKKKFSGDDKDKEHPISNPDLMDALGAQGGLISTPTTVGEAGPELVIPTNNIGRANNIINNYNNTNNFSMNGNQTALSLSQAISNNRFIRHAATI